MGGRSPGHPIPGPGAKARALLHGRPTPVEEDIRSIFKSALNHRILLNFQAEAENLQADALLDILLKRF